MTLAEEYVLSRHLGATIIADETRERTQVFCVSDGLSVWRFSEEDAWQDAMRRLLEDGPER